MAAASSAVFNHLHRERHCRSRGIGKQNPGHPDARCSDLSHDARFHGEMSVAFRTILDPHKRSSAGMSQQIDVMIAFAARRVDRHQPRKMHG